MATEVIREFLVALGYQVDEGAERRFVDGVDTAIKAALGLGAAIEAAAPALAAGVAVMATPMEKLSLASRRTGVPVESIQVFGAAVAQIGGTVERARSSLQALAEFMRSSPGAASWIQGLVDRGTWPPEIATATKLLNDFGRNFSFWAKGMGQDSAEFGEFPRTVFAGEISQAIARIRPAFVDDHEKDPKRLFAPIEGLFNDFAGFVSRVFGSATRDAFDLVWSHLSPIFDGTAESGAGGGAVPASTFRPPAANGVAGAGGSDRLAAGRGARRSGPAGERGLDVQHAISFFQGKGWSLAQAAGLVANLYAESSLDPRAVDDGGQAVGIAQWHPDRQAAIEAHFGKRLRDMTLDEQLAAVDWELREGGEQRAGGMLTGATTAPQAGSVVSRFYERPRDTEGAVLSRAASAGSMVLNVQRMAAAGVASPGSDQTMTPAPITISQETSVTVHGAGQPQETAQAIRGELDRRDADLIRNTMGAVR